MNLHRLYIYGIALLSVLLAIVAVWPGAAFAEEIANPTATQAKVFLPLLNRVNADPPIRAWRGEYFANRTLAGSPTLVRSDDAIQFDWANGAPAAGLPADGFSARWTRTLAFAQGTYRFFVRSDDGVRVWLDGVLVIDEWHDSDSAAYSSVRPVSGGDHNLRIEYYEATGLAGIHFWWERIDEYPQWRGEYFPNQNLAGAPALVRNDANLDFNWGAGAPASGLPVDLFSVRWTRTLDFAEGKFRFHAMMDDGLRLFVDGHLLIDEWRNGSQREVVVDRQIGQGAHSVRVEYYEHGGDARVQVWWEKVQPAPSYPDWKGEYWPNTTLSGSPVLVRNDANLDFNWGISAPGSGLPTDGFSARWTRSAHFDAGTYRFHVTVDDGARLWVGSQLLVDDWRDGGVREIVRDLALTADSQALRVEYYENTGEARIQVWWEKVQSTPPSCVELLQNGGFEDDAAWIMRNNPVLAGYVAAPVLGGQRSLRTGIPAGGRNVESYSPAEQGLTIPAWAGTARLRFSRSNVWEEGHFNQALIGAIDLATMPQTEAELATSVFVADFFYVIAIRDNGGIDWFVAERLDNPSWRETVVDLSRYAGQPIRLQFGTYNNGHDGTSRTFVDNASVQACR